MKRRLSLLLAMVLALTMVMGISVTAFAADPPTIDGDDSTKSFDSGIVDVDSSSPVVVKILFNSLDGLEVRDYTYINDQKFDEYSYDVYTPGDNPWEMYRVDSSTIDILNLYIDTSDFGGGDFVYKQRITWSWIDGKGQRSCYYYTTNYSPTPGPGSDPCSPSTPAHVHNFQWQTITEPTKDADGLEGEVCSCGATRNTQKLSAYGYALNQYATPMINAAKAGQTITFEFGEWNSFPKSFMAKLVDKSAQNVTFVFKYKWNHKLQTITIPAGTPIDLNFDWYGPAKMAELYGAN